MAIEGGSVDRPPVAIWGHDFLREGSAQDLAAQTIELQKTYGYDFIKINPRWTLFAEPWGNRYEPPVEQKFPKLMHRVLTDSTGFSTIPVVSADHPVLLEDVAAVSTIVEAIGEEVDCIATLFSPLACLGLLAGGVGQPLLKYMSENKSGAHDALAHITQTLTGHAQALVDAGAAGIFFAPLPWTSLDQCPASVYEEFGRPYDFKVLEAVVDAPLNMLHVCGNHIGMERFYDYPVPILNWDNFGEGNPTLAAC